MTSSIELGLNHWVDSAFFHSLSFYLQNLKRNFQWIKVHIFLHYKNFDFLSFFTNFALWQLEAI